MVPGPLRGSGELPADPGARRVASSTVSEAGPQEWRCGEYVISDDPARLDVDTMHDFLEAEGCWAQGRSRAQTAVAAANSLVLGLYGPDGSMVGGARVVTDRATFGWLTDVYVLAEHRGQGLGRALAAATCEHPAVAGIKRLLLVTADAHEMYRPLGFVELPQPERWMELRPVPGGLPASHDPRDSDGRDSDGRAEHDTAAEPLSYTAWQGGGLPDPRTAPVSQIASHLLEIVAAEGPVTADRAYRLYIRGAGSSKVTQRARAPLEQALGRLLLRCQVDAEDFDNGGETQQVLRLAGTPSVVARELGERSLYDVPLNEVASLMAHQRRELLRPSARGEQSSHVVAEVIMQAALRRASPERVKRAVLDAYGLIRMTQAAEQYLSAALDLLEADA